MSPTAQEQIDTRAYEIAVGTRADLAAHKNEDAIHFANVREDVAELKATFKDGFAQMIGAVNSLRADDSAKRGEIYKKWDGYKDKAIWALGVAVVAIALYVWKMKVGG